MGLLDVNDGFYDFHSCPQVTFAPPLSDSMSGGAIGFKKSRQHFSVQTRGAAWTSLRRADSVPRYRCSILKHFEAATMGNS
jgi:hypothetical protein